jgi:cell division protein FtsI (penicillin-binding protein 3)
VVKAHSGYKTDYTKLLEFIGIEYENNSGSKWVNMEAAMGDVSMETRKIKMKKVPDVRGMGLRDAIYVLESLGMDVEVDGMGQVYKQSIKPGIDIAQKDIKIYLR